MKTTKIKIRNLFGIAETELDGKSVEITGGNGVGKTSVIDSIRYALTNSSNRDYVVRKGENEGEIIVETDTGLYINRKKRQGQTDYKSVKENGRDVSSPENFLRQLFTPMQLNPVEFTQMSRQEQNRVILNLIEFDWDLNWIKEQFGEIPQGVNYEQHILQVLNDIQADNGYYFKEREAINRDGRNKKAFVAEIATAIPANYNAEHWEQYDLGAAYSELQEIKAKNAEIEKAQMLRGGFNDKLRGLQAKRDIAINAEQANTASERSGLTATIERLKAEIIAAQDKLAGLDDKLADKIKVIEAEFEASKAKLNASVQNAADFADKEKTDTSALEAEVKTAEEMKKHLNEYRRMKSLKAELEQLAKQSEELTRKITLARELPGEILKTATIPVAGLTVENGIPLINGLPISNLSEGEQLELCVDVALSKPNNLQIILIDGAEKLSEKNRQKLYAKCKEKGLQFIATRTTDSDEMEVNYL